jgi:hypothetical protein
MAQVEHLLIKFEELWLSLYADNDRIKNEILMRVEDSLDNKAVGGEGYGQLRRKYLCSTIKLLNVLH